MTDYAKLDAWIDAHFDDEVKFLQQLVRVPTDTPPGNNAPHAERTAELLKDFGFEAEKHPVPAQEVADYGLESITNLIVRRQYGAAGEGLTVALNAHGDVVPPGEGWTHDPYGGEIDDGSVNARARSRRQADQGHRRIALHLRRGIRRPSRPGLAAEERPDKARLDDRCWLQLRSGHRAQRLPADGSNGARQDGTRRDS